MVSNSKTLFERTIQRVKLLGDSVYFLKEKWQECKLYKPNLITVYIVIQEILDIINLLWT